MSLVFLVGCSNVAIDKPAQGNPLPNDFLKNGNADIFLLDGIVYANAQHVEWITKLDYTIGDEIGEITKQTGKSFQFKNGAATTLHVGAKIYETDTPIYIAIVNGNEIPYLEMAEG